MVVGCRGGVDHGGVGRPPADIAGAFVQVAVDQLDGVERQVDQARALGLGRQIVGQAFQRGDFDAQFVGHQFGDVLDLTGNLANFIGDDGETGAHVAGALGFDQGIERQDAQHVGDAGDIAQPPGGDGLGFCGMFGDVADAD